MRGMVSRGKQDMFVTSVITMTRIAVFNASNVGSKPELEGKHIQETIE